MTHRRLLTCLLALAALGAPAGARAAVRVSPSEVIDGPSVDILAVGGVSIARDGTGTVVYVKRDANVDHVFASDLVNGVWQPPQRVDGSLATAASEPVVSVTNAGRSAIAFTSGGVVYGIARPAFGVAYTAPQALAPGGMPDISMGVNGTAYATFTNGADVRAAYLDRTGTAFALIPSILDANPAQPAGDSPARRPRVAASADGTGIAVWGEQAIPGSQHVFARRLLRNNSAQSFTDLNVAAVDSHAGGDADSPAVSIEDDSSFAWVVFRQALDGTPRALARRLEGSQFTNAQIIDGEPFPATEAATAPAIAINGTGDGLASDGRASTHQVMGAPLVDNTFDIGAGRLDSAPANVVDALPLVASSQNKDGVIAWQQSTGSADPAEVHARLFSRGSFTGESLLTKPVLGPIDSAGGFRLAVDRVDDAAVVAIQAGTDGRRLVAGMIDQGPRSFSVITRALPRGTNVLRWTAPLDLWGPLKYTVKIDGKVVGRTTATHLTLRRRPKAGTRAWQVIAVDRRGTSKASYARRLVVAGPRRK